VTALELIHHPQLTASELATLWNTYMADTMGKCMLIHFKDTVEDENIRRNLQFLSDKIRGIYIGSQKEEKELNLKEETLKKYNLLAKAIKEKRKVKILYYSYNTGENERIIRPYDMFFYTNGWGVAAYCELKKDLRHFELKRIIKCELLDEFYE
jgi:hypothetical protein